jgi:hypothetical protein
MPRGGRRAGRGKGEQLRPHGLPGYPSRASALYIAAIVLRNATMTRVGEVWGKGDLPRPPGLLGRPHTLHHSSLLTKVIEPSCQSEPPCIILQLDLAACAARRGEVGSRRGQPASQAIHQPHKGKESLAATLIASPPGLCRRASSDGDTTRWREGSDRVRVRESPPVSLESDAGARGNFRVRLLRHS